MLDDIKKDAQIRMAKSVEALRHALVKIRTGRASTGLVDSIRVSAYGDGEPDGLSPALALKQGLEWLAPLVGWLTVRE